MTRTKRLWYCRQVLYLSTRVAGRRTVSGALGLQGAALQFVSWTRRHCEQSMVRTAKRFNGIMYSRCLFRDIVTEPTHEFQNGRLMSVLLMIMCYQTKRYHSSEFCISRLTDLYRNAGTWYALRIRINFHIIF